ncbi:GTP 3',8-cyclase MoaA [Pseudoxanthomonas sacheonensis]|uniref:GTP 3',8-cyclase MoaA n=1 Tax=Pseudoxanthomonas sacheonensis TaxID=443615 RepID=UPI0013D1E864|nr:GTP 3',8-cyclase MoaA [Pseudoxanthomonas sacheonensis]KAF1707185.1 GTP 3',8-cyclase MoaA [Pseudoxanthomonas sacheonensis]
MSAVPQTQAWPPGTPLGVPLDRRGRPLRDLRLSVIEACNFRCGYCMPADQVPDDYGLDSASRLSFDEIETLVRGFVRIGVSKLRLTGGEPLLRKRLPELIARLSAVPGIEDLALTTNGSLLAAQARALHRAGLRRLTVSLDALDADLFRQMSGGRGELSAVMAGIDAATRAGFASLKINCVVQRGVNENQVLPLAEHFRGSGHVLRFIEYMDVGTCNGWRRAQVVASAELRDRIAARWPIVPLDANYRGEVAKRYRFQDGAGEIGFVSSVSETFCGDCHRARVSADGQLYTCLFASEGADLRGALAQGEAAFADHLAGLWSRREDRYSELRGEREAGKGRHVEMFLIGG